MRTKKIEISNETESEIDIRDIDFMQYGRVIFFGKPLRSSAHLLELMHRLRANGYKGEIVIDTDEGHVKSRWSDKAVLMEADYVKFRICHQPDDDCVKMVKHISRLLAVKKKGENVLMISPDVDLSNHEGGLYDIMRQPYMEEAWSNYHIRKDSTGDSGTEKKVISEAPPQ